MRDSLRNATIVAMAIGGSTNVTLHAPEIARAAGYADFWKDIITPEECNYLSQHIVPVLTDARPYGKYSMVDIDRVGGIQVIVREFLDAGLLNGDVMTCTGETLAAQVERLGAKRADGKVIYTVTSLRRPAACACWAATCRPDSPPSSSSRASKRLENNIFRGKAGSSRAAGPARCADQRPSSSRTNEMVSCATKGERRAGQAGMLDPPRASRLCRERA